ncbi:MAG TPA: sensor domain-containing diguanylate cyclase [Aquabacterium sp.]|nr:sensor domain-containing diguanylate cyclase [Aquabacterium sp.]
MSIEQYPTFIHEPKRLAALKAYELLDTPAEADFDAVVRLLSQVVRAPTAWVGLLDAERVWFKAQCGLSEAEWLRDDWVTVHLLSHPRECWWCTDLGQESRWQSHPWSAALPQARFMAAAPVVDVAGHVLGMVGVASPQAREFDEELRAQLQDAAVLVASVMESRKRAWQLARQAMTDPLTGIGNKVQFDLALQVEMGHAMRSGEPFTVLCMDLDGFKAVNDGFGHAAGDEVLCEVAKRLQQQVRLGDTLVRLRDDEFAVVMRHGAEDAAAVLSKRVVQAISQPIDLTTGDTVGVGISIGMAAYDDQVCSGQELVKKASESLQLAKRRNERRWNMFLGGGRRLF